MKFKNEWIKKTEELDPSWLKKEGNIIFFNVPEGATYQYKIRNLVVKVVEKPIETNSKIVNNLHFQFNFSWFGLISILDAFLVLSVA